jgi:hypothetical protein
VVGRNSVIHGKIGDRDVFAVRFTPGLTGEIEKCLKSIGIEEEKAEKLAVAFSNLINVGEEYKNAIKMFGWTVFSWEGVGTERTPKLAFVVIADEELYKILAEAQEYSPALARFVSFHKAYRRGIQQEVVRVLKNAVPKWEAEQTVLKCRAVLSLMPAYKVLCEAKIKNKEELWYELLEAEQRISLS